MAVRAHLLRQRRGADRRIGEVARTLEVAATGEQRRQSGNDEEYNGEVYKWSKHHEWEKFLDLPQRTSQPFEVALKIDDPNALGPKNAYIDRHIPRRDVYAKVWSGVKDA